MNTACSSEQIVIHFLPQWAFRRHYAEKIVELAQESAKVSKADGLAKIKDLEEQKIEAERAMEEAEENRQARLRARYGREYRTKDKSGGRNYSKRQVEK
jgi:hypothetical protein